MSDWIEGEPSEDGLYAVVSEANAENFAADVLRRVKSKWYSVNRILREASGCSPAKILRHYRLPEPQQPLKPLRRFTAKIKREQVTGCERRFALPHSGELFCERRDGSWFFAYHHELTDLQWIDEP